MPKIQYVEHKFGADALAILVQAEKIINEYTKKGFSLTLRQLYYAFVSRALIPNTIKSYKRLGGIINDGRMAGLIDWNAIEDRTRETVTPPAWDDPADIIRSAAASYKRDLWLTQDNRVYVWVEKEALAGIVGQVCSKLYVPYLSCRGYTSQSEMWSSARRLLQVENHGQKTIILHLGDHDPSGIDMTRDITDRLALFESSVEVHRIALNMDQIDEYHPPPNPAKVTDSRFDSYEEEYGDESWELDALDPQVMSDLIESKVKEHRDEDRWTTALDEQEAHRAQLMDAAKRWDEVVDFLDGNG